MSALLLHTPVRRALQRALPYSKFISLLSTFRGGGRSVWSSEVFFFLWQDCLECFFQPDTLTLNNQIHCYWCGGNRDATVKASITRAPKIIIFHLKRYSLSGVGHSQFLGSVRHGQSLMFAWNKSLQISGSSTLDTWKLNGHLERYRCQTLKLHCWILMQCSASLCTAAHQTSSYTWDLLSRGKKNSTKQWLTTAQCSGSFSAWMIPVSQFLWLGFQEQGWHSALLAITAVETLWVLFIPLLNQA